MNSKIIALLLLTLLAHLQISDTIQCYQCQSKDRENYFEWKDDTLPPCGSTIASSLAVKCPGDTVCQYFEVSVNNTKTTVRTCAPIDGCEQFSIEEEDKILNCYTCEEDLCNKKSNQPVCTKLTMDINLNVNLNVRNYNDNTTATEEQLYGIWVPG